MRRVVTTCVLSFSLVLAACSGVEQGPSPSVVEDGAVPDDRIPASVRDQLMAGEGADIVLLLAEQGSPKNALVVAPSDDTVRYAEWAIPVMDTHVGSDIELIAWYRHFPMLAMRVHTYAAIEALAADARIDRIYANETFETTLTQSLALIGQPAAAADGFDGSGTTVAVLDTGLDYTRAAFGTCTAPNTPSGCRVNVAQDFAPSDGVRDQGNYHGTNVSGIVAGVAPGAKVAGLDVFRNDGLAYTNDLLSAIDWVVDNHETYNIVAMNMSLGSGSYTARCPSNVLETSLAAARAVGVMTAVATGNNGYTNAISQPACAPSAVAVGAVYDGAVGTFQGACTAVSAADKVTCFSNSASFMDILAPGAPITAAGITMNGTSQASPHVAGAIAVLRAAFPSETPDQTLTRLTSNGTSVTDYRNGIVKPRLNLAASVNDCVNEVTPVAVEAGSASSNGSVTVTAESGCDWTATSNAAWLTFSGSTSATGSGSISYTVAGNTAMTSRSGTMRIAGRTVTVTQARNEPPASGAVEIAEGASFTRTRAVTLTLAAQDEDSLATMCISNTTTCTAWIPYATTKAWTLTDVTGLKTVRVWYRDSNGNTTPSPASDTITLDLAAPTNGTVTPTGGNAQVALSWSGFTDSSSGIASYKVVQAPTTAPASCGAGTVVYTGTSTSTTASSLTNGSTYGFRVCAIDGVGNMSTGATTTSRPAPEYAAPTGIVEINAGDANTRLVASTVTIVAFDDNDVTQMCISNSTTCTAWIPHVTNKSWTLTTGTGTKTVRVWLRDEFGNTSTTPVSDTILLDATAPGNGTVTPTGGDAQVALSWTGFTDANTGIASYKVVYQAGTTAPASCNVGTVAYTGSGTSTTVSSLTNGNTYAFRVCATDGVGNVSSGATITARPAPEYAAPSGTVAINGGDSATRLVATTLTLAATDTSNVTSMCISNTTTCTSWIAFATTKAWTLPTGTGTKTVRVWFRDQYGNASAAAATDTILLDSTLPSNGTASATPGNAQVALSWSGFSDAQTGVASYKVVYQASTAPASCSAGTVGYTGTGTSGTIAGLTNGTTYGFRVCAIDTVGNVSSGATVSARPAPEYDAPTNGSLSINAGDASTRTTSVTLTISADDDSGVTSMCITNTTTCSAWVAYATTKTWTLATGTGTKFVNVFFRDVYGNTTASAAGDSILLDATAPTNGTVTPTGDSGEVELSWSGFADAHTGVASYKVVYQAGTAAPTSCSAGTVGYTGTSTSATISSLTNGTTYAFRVCAIDNVGNTSTGATTTARPAPEYTAPASGSLIINNGATTTTSRSVVLTIDADDESGVAKMCVSNTTTCTAWINYVESMAWTLTTGYGSKTVRVWFRDIYGNATASAVSAAITYGP